MYPSGENPSPLGDDFSLIITFVSKKYMQNYRKTIHGTYDCKYHIVWITKYRKRILSGVIS